MNISLTNYSEKTEKIFWEKFGAEKWVMNKSELSPEIFFENRKLDLIQLSPDGEIIMEKVEMDKIYIIGGLVDNKIKKNASKEIAE